MQASRRVRIVNTKGLHARPCHAIVSAALDFKSDLRIASSTHRVNGRSILELMTLSAACGSELEIFAEGEDAQELVDQLVALIEAGFDEVS